MTEATPVVVLSSGGKDSLYMLETLRGDPAWQVEALVTTVNETNHRVAMHGTSGELLRAQADSLGIELVQVGLPEACDNQEYERRLKAGLEPFRKSGLKYVACGDLFLADIRQWRERLFERMGWRPRFPIWHTPTDRMARALCQAHWEIIVTCIDTVVLDEALLGQRLDASFLDRLPASVDPCGENGEFHTFVCNGPGFRHPVAVRPGERHLAHGRYLMIDLLPA